MSDQEFIELLNGVFYITTEGVTNCGQIRVNIIKNVKNNKSRFIEQLPIGNVGDYIKIDNLRIKTVKFVKRKILNIFYKSIVLFPVQENDLIEIIEDEKFQDLTLTEFKTYPNNSGFIKLKDAKEILTTKNTTPCAVIGKGINIELRPAKKEGLTHLVVDILSGSIRYNIIGWNFIDSKTGADIKIPDSDTYVFYNIKVGELNNKCYLNLENMSVILYKFCDEYQQDMKNITCKWNELHYNDFRWYRKQQSMVSYSKLEEALEHVNCNINSPVIISMDNVVFDSNKWITRFFIRHSECGNVTPYSVGLLCTKCHQSLEEDNNWWLLTTTTIQFNGKKFNVKINDTAHVKLLNQIDLDVLGVKIEKFTSFMHFKNTIKDNPIGSINELEELYVDYLDNIAVSIQLKVNNNEKGDIWAITYDVMDISFD